MQDYSDYFITSVEFIKGQDEYFIYTSQKSIYLSRIDV
jgi:hypothetical protein